MLALMMTVVVLSGCSSNNNSSSSNPDSSISSGSEDNGVTSTTKEESSKSSSGGELNLFTWEGMFPEEVLTGFTEKTGIKVNYSNFDVDETMLAKLEAAKGGDYDVVIADDYIIETVIKENLAQELDKSKLSNYSSINPVYQGQFFDPEDAYTVPYGAGVQTIVYNPAYVDIDIKGYADLWDESLKDSVGITESFRVINGMSLKMMGESYNVEDVSKIESAGEKLLELAPNIRLIKDSNIQDDMISGEINAAVMYTSQVTMSMLADSSLKMVYPEEGIGFGIMANFIPVNAPHTEEAYEFINYILDPEVSAKCFEFLGYYCTNLDAEEFISDEIKDYVTLPDEIDLNNMEMIENISADALEAHQKLWTEFKAACGE